MKATIEAKVRQVSKEDGTTLESVACLNMARLFRQSEIELRELIAEYVASKQQAQTQAQAN